MTARPGDLITTAEEWDALPDLTGVVQGSDVGQRLGGLWHFPETAPLTSAKVSKYGHGIVLWLPGYRPRPEGIVKGEALDEAAAQWQVKGWSDDLPPAGADRPALILGMAQRAVTFLRARAERLRSEA